MNIAVLLLSTLMRRLLEMVDRSVTACRSGNIKNWAHFVALGQVGGVEASCLAFVERLNKQDSSKQTLFADRVHSFWKTEWPHQGVERRSFKRIGGVRLPSRPRALQAYNLSRHLKALKPEALVFWNLLHPPEVMERARQRVPTVIYLERGMASLARGGSNLKASMPYVDLVIANSHASRRTLQLRWEIEQPIVVVPNPLRPQFNEPVVGSPTARGRAVPPFKIGMAGRLKPFKGFALGIHALRKLLDQGIHAHLAICGEGPDMAGLQRLAESLGVDTHIEWLGTQSNMAEFYDALDVFLCPSLREPFGLVSIEAQARGVPVVATAIDGLPETIEAEQTGVTVLPTVGRDELTMWGVATEELPDRVYSPASDRLEPICGPHPKALAEALAKLLVCSGCRDAMSSNAIERVQKYFSMESYVGKITEIVQEIRPLRSDSR